MNLDLVNNIVNDVKKNKIIESFIKDLQNYLENNVSKNNNTSIKKADIQLVNTAYNENKIITKYRDKMLIERANILNKYAIKTANKGEMYYIYSKNSKMEDGYNLCICKKGESHNIIELDKNKLPNGVKIGSVLRKTKNNYILDKNATKEIETKIYNMKFKLLEEQTKFLESKRIEGHIYEMSENNGDRAWLFDITSGNTEGVEEIDFPTNLLENSKEGDLFVYENGEYRKY